jgi:hypothetical protein
VKIQNFWGQSVAGRPHFLAARSAPEPNSTLSFPIAFYPLITQHSYAWNGKILRRSDSLPLKSLNSPPSPSFLFQSFDHLLSFHGSFQYFLHYCRREDDPAFERGNNHQKKSLEMSLQDSHFQNVTKMPLHCDTLHANLNNASTILVTLYF